MVFFTCNHCGEAVKKPAVEKHYTTKCRNAKKSVSCMDCQKDFQDNYVEHTKCITEMQKYSGKDYVPRESQNSGAKKQEGWTEVVRSVLNSEEHQLSEKTKRAFITLQNYDNVPRKKAKFLNFVTNSVRLPRQTVEEVWNILEKEQEKMKQARQAEQNANKNVPTTETENELKNEANQKAINDSGEVVNIQQNGHINGKEKKKKHKKSKAEQENTPENDLVKGEVATDVNKKKKKNENVPEVPTEAVDTTAQNGQTKPKKIKKHKLVDEHTVDEAPSKKEKKDATVERSSNEEKSQSKKKNHKEVVENGSNEEEPAKKKLKTDAKDQTNDVAHQNSEEVYQFCWDTELARVIGKHSEGITLEKLKKKLLKKFKTKFADSELTERQEKGFEKKLNKKLKKSTTLQLEGDLVKPCS